MARIRTIKPEFPQSESMGRISRDARLLFVQIWTICDDEGKARANSRMLASLLFPYDEDASALMDGWLSELEREKCVVRYKIGVDSFIAVTNWISHQKIDRPSKSRISNPPTLAKKTRKIANPREASSGDQGPKEGIKDSIVAVAPVDLFLKAYPKKEARGAAIKAFTKACVKTTPDILIAGALAYAAKRAGQDKQFTKLPATWLNQECWLDEGIAPAMQPDAEADALARAAWDGEAGKLVAEIGVASFQAFFAGAQFQPGPPARIVVAKAHMRDLIARKFSAPLKRVFCEFELEVAA